MIYRLRKRFIEICMVSFIAVFLIIFGTIYIITYFQTNKSLDILADVISENEGHFPKYDEFVSKKNNDGELRKPDNINRESPFTTRYFTVKYNKVGEVIMTDTKSIASVSSAEALSYANEATEKGKTRGWIDNYRFKVSENNAGTTIIFVSGAMEKASNNRFMISVLSVFCGGSIVVLLLVIIFSKKAVKPTAESYEKQKQFITDANHELKTPLTLIRADIDIAESEIGKNEWLDDIKDESSRMSELVNRLVSLARMDEEKTDIEKLPFNLSNAVDESLSVFEGIVAQKNISLITDIAPSVEYTGDEGLIRQLISILMDNAIKYCDSNGTIKVMLCGGRHKLLTVDNSYREVGSTELSRLFDRFYRSDKARTYGSGYGIGLSIAKQIVEKHRGEITAKNVNGTDIRFSVKL